MLSDHGLQYGLDVDQEDDEPPKIVSHIVTKDLETPLSLSELNTNNAASRKVPFRKNNEADADDADEDDNGVDNVDDMVGRTDVAANATDNEGQSMLHLPHARWPNHWSDTAPSHMTAAGANEVTYKWLTSPWTTCSQKCGAAGSGLRVSCMHTSS